MTINLTEEDLSLTLSNAEYAVEEHDIKELSRLARVDIPELVTALREERSAEELRRSVNELAELVSSKTKRIAELEEENEYLRRAYSTMAEHVAHSSTNEHWRRQAKDVLERLG